MRTFIFTLSPVCVRIIMVLLVCSCAVAEAMNLLPAPPAPTGLTASAITTTSFTVTWNAASGATSYRLDVSTTNTFSSYVTGYQDLSVSGTSQAIGGLSANTTYYFRVRSVNSSGTSGNSSTASKATIPAAPVLGLASVTSSWITLSYTYVAGLTYYVDLSTDPSFSTFVYYYNNYALSGTQLTSSVYPATTTYYCRMRVVNSSGASANSTVLTILRLPATPVATAPTNVAETSFTANWNSADAASDYLLDISTNSSFTSFVSGFQNLPVTGVSKNITGLLPDRKYFYRLKARNTSGISAYSNTIQAVYYGNWITYPNGGEVLTTMIGYNCDIKINQGLVDDGNTMYELYQGTVRIYPPTGSSPSGSPCFPGNVVGDNFKIRVYNLYAPQNEDWSDGYFSIVAEDKNYIRVEHVLVEGKKEERKLAGLLAGEITTTHQFFDGLGRPVQTVIKQGSPSLHDIVQPVAYDLFGRESRRYLPYISADGNGWLKADALADPETTAITETDQYRSGAHYEFYQTGNSLAADQFPYAQTILESSPLSRLIKTGAPGQPWQPDATHTYMSTDHTTKYRYQANEATDVLLWVFQSDPANPFGLVNASSGSVPTYYPAGSLFKSSTKDEEQHEVIEFTSKQGKALLKKVQTDGGTYAYTYYLYDDFGNLVCVVPPEASTQLTTQYFNKTNPEKESFLARWAFRYAYDSRGRMTHKQVPGAEPVYMIYDKLDRLVLTQDAVQRVTGYWTFTKYDKLNRPILSGIKDTTAAVTQASMQGAVDAWYDPAKPWHTFGETYTGTGEVHGYTNTSYPKTTSPATLDANRYLTVAYYDNYTFKTLWASTYNYLDENLTKTVNTTVYNQPNSEFASLKGQMTGNKIKVLDGGVTGGVTWLKAVHYYDDKYRLIQVIADNYKQGTDRTSSLYDFAGKVLRIKSTHDEFDISWKDLTSGVTKSGERLYRSTGGSDNNQGAASTAMLPASTDGWFEFTHSNANNLYIGLSAANTGTAYSAIDYCLQVGGSTCSAIQPGQGTVNLGVHTLGDVFRIERFSGTVRIRKNGALIHSFAGTSISALLVDVSFYSGQSSVLFARSSFSTSSHVILRTFDFDHAGRLINIWHKLDNGPEILLSKNEYNELGQLIDKKLHSTVSNGSDSRQSVDYRYNIRGWLTKLNDAALSETGENQHDLFGFELGYNEDIGISSTALYNGNISGMKWSNNLGLSTTSQNAYTYIYDIMNRILSSTFKEKASGSWNTLGDSRNAESGFEYDLNGNITKLKRNDKRISGLKMDDLVYNYGTGISQSNKLLKVTDNGDDYKGFMDGTNGANDYTYDGNGNMLTDYNKGISTAITYNYLNLPEVIVRGGSTNTIRYIYDATGRKLSQIVSLTGVPKQTDYSGEYVYENDALQFITHEEGRIVMTKEEKIFAFDGSHQNGITAMANVSLTHETIGAETYLKASAVAGTVLTKLGITPIGGSFPVTAGQRYAYRVKGYRSGEAVSLYVKGNSTDLVWPGAQLTPATGHRNDVWVETFFTIPAGITSIELGVLWNTNGAPTTQYFYINELELIRLDTQVPEYQYDLKDHLGNVRLTFTTDQETDEATATLETGNTGAESGEFIYYNEAVKINSTLFDHSNNGATHYAARLTGSANERYGLAKSISVMPGDTIRASVYAKYLDTNNGNWTTPLANLMAAIANGTAPAGTFVDGGLTGSTGGATPSFASLLNKGSETGTAPKAYLNYIVFDRNFAFKDGGFIRVTTAAREYGQDGAHEELFKEIAIKEPGYVYLYLSNDTYALGGPLTEVYFDDFTVEHAKSPVIQTDDYYAFGLNFNSYQRENSKGNNFLYNDKEKQDELGLDWLDYGARMYMPEIGRWGVIDPLGENMASYSPYNYAFDNPIKFIDRFGLAPSDSDDPELMSEFEKRMRAKERQFNMRDGGATYIGKSESTGDSSPPDKWRANRDGTFTLLEQTEDKFHSFYNEDDELIWQTNWTEKEFGEQVQAEGGATPANDFVDKFFALCRMLGDEELNGKEIAIMYSRAKEVGWDSFPLSRLSIASEDAWKRDLTKFINSCFGLGALSRGKLPIIEMFKAGFRLDTGQPIENFGPWILRTLGGPKPGFDYDPNNPAHDTRLKR